MRERGRSKKGRVKGRKRDKHEKEKRVRVKRETIKPNKIENTSCYSELVLIPVYCSKLSFFFTYSIAGQCSTIFEVSGANNNILAI